MNQRRHFSEVEIDSLVGAVLRDEGRRVDVQRNLAAIERRASRSDSPRQGALPPGGQSRRRLPAIIGKRGFSIAAVVLLAVGLAWWLFSSTPASAYAILSAAQSQAEEGPDRCYRVKADVPKWWGARNPLVKREWNTLVWTRGDRFRAVMRAPGRELVWGQDEQRNVWLVQSPSRGLTYAHAETPPKLTVARSCLCLDVARLTKRFLNHYDLAREEHRPTVGARVAVVRATAKPDRRNMEFNSARLVIDLDTNVIREMDLVRVVNGKVAGTVSFVLLDQSPQSDSSYRLSGHLASTAEILAGDRSDERAAAFEELLNGPREAP